MSDIWDYADHLQGANEVTEKRIASLQDFECGGYRGQLPASVTDEVLVPVYKTRECPYCGGALRELTGRRTNRPGESLSEHSISGFAAVVVCDVCGWWKVENNEQVLTNYHYRAEEFYISYLVNRVGMGSLRNLDLNDISTPISELKSYLLAKYKARFTLTPRKFEELVGSIFSDFGYKVRLTSYSGDRGIDIVVFDNDDSTIGVQVKRYAGKVEAEQIRALAGSLVLNGHTKGVFVTTSGFTKGSQKTARQYEALGFPIELINAKRFYDCLAIGRTGAWTAEELGSKPLSRLLENPRLMAAVSFQADTY